MQQKDNLNARTVPQPGQIYRHFKGNIYQIVTVAEHTESGEAMVVYQALYGTFKVYVRPLTMFLSEVDREKYPDVVQKYRFEQQWMTEEAAGQDEHAQQSSCSAEVQQVVRTTQAKHIIQAQPDTEKHMEENAIAQPRLDDGVWEFLDAGSYEERLRIFTGMQHRLTDDMINIMAASMDTEVPEAELGERITSLKSFLLTQVKFECSRIM